MTLKRYKDFIKEGIAVSDYDRDTELYLEGSITFGEWEENFDILNEGLTDILQSKIFPVLKTLKAKMKNSGIKAIKLLKKIYLFILKFTSDSPVLVRVMVTILLLFTIGIVTVSAATGSDPSIMTPNTEVLNAAIGFVEDLHSEGAIPDIVEKMEVQAYLVDLRNDGVIDENWSDKVLKMGNKAIELMRQAGRSDDYQPILSRLVDFGSQIKGYIFTEIESLGHISKKLTLK